MFAIETWLYFVRFINFTHFIQYHFFLFWFVREWEIYRLRSRKSSHTVNITGNQMNPNWMLLWTFDISLTLFKCSNPVFFHLLATHMTDIVHNTDNDYWFFFELHNSKIEPSFVSLFYAFIPLMLGCEVKKNVLRVYLSSFNMNISWAFSWEIFQSLK